LLAGLTAKLSCGRGREKEADMPLFGPPDLSELAARRDLNGLIKALGYRRDASLRRGAANALAAIGDPRAVGPLIGALHDEDR
jgi:HEAT repeat protein